MKEYSNGVNQDVAVSVLACVAHVDDASDDDKVPPKSWPAVQKVDGILFHFAEITWLAGLLVVSCF